MTKLNTVVVAARKGGVGKSTTVRNLACASVLRGAQTGIVDCDPQGTTTYWWNSRAVEDIVL
jgi:chromosome partitioning protein